MLRWVIVALAISTISCREFQNPVIHGGENLHAGVILYRGQYYAVTSTYNFDEPNKFPIHMSSDLQNWHKVGYALPDGYLPEWTGPGYYSPEIHQIGENDFRLFYFTTDRESGMYAIAVGVSHNVQGPYAVQDRPLLANLTTYHTDPTLVQDGGRKYLVWSDYGAILGRELNPDCLDFLAGSTQKLILPSDLPWEGNNVAGAWYVRRPDAWYMFYSGNGDCSDAYGVGVARSQNPLGPFEKRGQPILGTNFDYQAPGQVSVVSDIYISTAVMVYHAFKSGHTCQLNETSILSQSVEWGYDGWPIIIPY